MRPTTLHLQHQEVHSSPGPSTAPGSAAVAKGVKGLCSLVPLGEYLYEVAEDVVERVQKEKQQHQFRQDVEQLVKASVDECARRDVKGLYEKALRGEIKEFTGVSDPYEAPEDPEIRIESEH